MPLHNFVDEESNQTMSGGKTLLSPLLIGGECSADPTEALGIATKQYADAVISQRDAYNAIMNGNFQIWNRGTSVFSAMADGTYTADRWRYGKSGVGVNRILRGQAPTVFDAGVRIPYGVQIDCTTIDAAIGAGDFYEVSQRVEGYRWQHLAQRICTLSFWVISSKTGIHCVSLRNNLAGTPDRSYVAEYTINNASVWQYITITLAEASPSTGTWDYTTGTGISVDFCLAAGSTWQTTPNGWRVGNFRATANQVNGMDNTFNFLTISGVRLEAGPAASAAIVRPYADDYDDCERYLQMSFPEGVTPVQNAGVAGSARIGCNITGAVAFFSNTIPFRQRMRPGGTGTLYNPSAANAQIRNFTGSVDFTASSITEVSENGIAITGTGNAGAAVGEQLGVHWLVTSEL